MSAGADEGRPGLGRPAEPRGPRDERAERLARLRGATAPAPEAPDADDPAALAAFLRVLRAAIADAPPDAADAAGVPPPVFAPVAAVLPFQRADRAAERGERASERRADPPPDPSPPGDLDRLPGAGPGLVWALQRAGVARLADLAARDPAPLGDRLGPVGALIDLPAWIAFARTATQTATQMATRTETDAPPA